MGKNMYKTIALLTLGCKLNYAETSTYERGFVEAGLKVVPWSAGADIYIINTCSVTATSDAKSRNLIRKVHRINPDACIVVTGCSAQLRRSEIEAIPGVSMVFGCGEKSRVVPGTLSFCGITEVSPDGKQDPFAAWSSGERTRSFLKVQDGCNNYCKYCTVPHARGESRNVPIAECVDNARRAAALGIKEIVLTGVNTGDFGRSTGESFLDLLRALNEVDGIERYRISSIEPNLLTEEIVDWTASGTKFQPHFHIPLQSGSDELLKRMGRRYDTDFFARKLEYVRKAMEAPGRPLVFFGIDVMAGLPGETDRHFADCIGFLKSVRPAYIHVFPYSRRPGTEAAAMDGQVSESVKKERVAELEKLCNTLHDEFVAANRGVHEKVLFESTDRLGYMEGYTGNYIRIRRPYEASLSGKIVDVII
ncbi:MAG: tRNA (N(6)-L-threonylcarbamoyladenosine(37)-C(2))-methylthiotransferase MtaB [Bacteroidales bacterium]|nr:tRNA (N(6)-L-threonylcarbamoyladenosine(37)-C(2))-methylthiotransferase MtaB [Bacteroidales bacterium]